jgi:hypothetical protein
MKTIFIIFYYFPVVFTVYFFAGAVVNVYSQNNTSNAMRLPDNIQKPLNIPKYPINKPLPREMFETHVYRNIFFYERIIPEDYKVDVNYSYYKKNVGYCLELCGYNSNYHYPFDLSVDYTQVYLAYYSELHDKDIFPLPGALFCRVKNPRLGYDVLRAKKILS